MKGVAASAGIFALALFGSAVAGFSRDEAWFLQVIDRVVKDDALYRDVFYLSTPLAVQLTAGVAHLFGSEILVEKSVTTLAFVGEILFASLLARELGAARRSSWLIWLGVFVYAQHYPNPPYRGMGSALMLGAFWALTVWVRVRSPRWLTITGALSGLSFSAMPNHGLLAFGSAGLVIALAFVQSSARPRAWIRAAGILTGAFVVPIAVIMAPVIAHGAVAKMLEYTVLNKGPYLEAGGVSYWTELLGLLTPDGLGLRVTLEQFYRGLPLVLFPVAAIGVLDVWRRASPEGRLKAAAVGLLIVSGFVGAYPRLNRFHLSYAMPGVVVALAYASETWSRFTRVSVSALRTVAAVWLLAGLVSSLLAVASAVRSPDRTWSTLTHFRSVLIGRADEGQIRDRAARLDAASRVDAPLLVASEAGLYYLTAGLKNPTPFDEPHLMNFGVGGEDWVIREIAARRLRAVCLGPVGDTLAPARIEQYVRATLAPVEDLGFCTLYR